MRLATKYFEKFANGRKTIECRLYDEKRRQLKIGDRIEFSDAHHSDKKITISIIALHQAVSFSALLDQFPIAQFGEDNKEQMLAALKIFYSEADEKKFGVVGIEIKLI